MDTHAQKKNPVTTQQCEHINNTNFSPHSAGGTKRTITGDGGEELCETGICQKTRQKTFPSPLQHSQLRAAGGKKLRDFSKQTAIPGRRPKFRKQGPYRFSDCTGGMVRTRKKIFLHLSSVPIAGFYCEQVLSNFLAPIFRKGITVT